MHKKRGGPRKSAALCYRLSRMLKRLGHREVRSVLDSEDLSVRSAQSVDNRSGTQSTHDLVAKVHVVAVQPSLQSALVAEQLHAVAAPVATEHGAQSSVDQTLEEAVADQGDNVGANCLTFLAVQASGR